MTFFLLIWSITSLGFFSLAASMEKHQKQLFSKPFSLKITQITKYLGWCILSFSLFLSIHYFSIANGVSYWIGILSFSALFVVIMLSYFIHYFKWINALLIIFIIFAIFRLY